MASLQRHQSSYFLEKGSTTSQVSASHHNYSNSNNANFNRIEEAKSQHLPVVDVDGSYLYKKRQLCDPHLTTLPPPPPPPVSGWVTVNESNVSTVSREVPVVTSGMLLFEPTGHFMNRSFLAQVYCIPTLHMVFISLT